MFAMEYIENQYIKKIVGECFEEFMNVEMRLDASLHDIAFVGSVAFAFKDILLQVLENHNIKCFKIIKSPMDGLIEYYQNVIA